MSRDAGIETTWTSSAGRIRLLSWLLTVLAWDGLLPLFVFSVPFVVEILVPNRRGAVELVAVAVPIVAFVVRYAVGRRHIATHNFSPAVRRVQFCVFVFGICSLVMIDSVLMLTHVMPKGALKGSGVVWAVLFSVYLTSMLIAMFPGPRPG
ncbi:MAG: hypothetical protein ACYC35_13730 [Pirellulales bacterium]